MPFEILIGGGALAFILIIVGAIITMTSDEALVEKRLGRYLDEDLKKAKEAPAEKSSPVGDWLNARMEHSKWGENLSRELARADLKLRPAEYVALMLIMAVGVGAVGWFAGGKSVIFGLLSAVIGLFMPRLMVKSSQAKRLKNFDEQLADMLNLMVNGLRAGYSTMQAMEAVSREMPPPICDEFRRVVQEMQLGIPMETALDNLLRRIPSDDLDLVITAINVQREVGGNLAEILEAIAHTIRERIKLKGEIRVLTSQGRITGWLISLLPIILTVFLMIVSPGYMGGLVENRMCGWPMLGIGLGLIGTGAAIIQKIVSIDY